MLASSAAERTGCTPGKQPVQYHGLFKGEGPVFLSGTSNMLILLGRGLELSLFLPRRIAQCWCQQHPQLHPAEQACGDVIISPVSMLSLPTTFGALAHCFRFQASSRHAVVNGITRISPNVTSKVDNIVHADHVVLLACWIGRS